MDLSSCTLDELNELIADEGWTLDQDLHIALQNRAFELDTEGVGLGPDHFWFDPQDYLTRQQLDNLLDDNFMEQQEGGGPVRQQPFDINKHVEISEEYNIHVKLFKTKGTGRSVQFKNLDQIVDVQQFSKEAIGALTEQCFEGVGPSDQVGMEVVHPGLNKPIYVPFNRRDKMSADTIAQKVEDVLNSNDEFKLDERMRWNFVSVQDTKGAGPTEEEVSLEMLVKVLNEDIVDDDGLGALIQELNDIEAEDLEDKNTYRRHKFKGNMSKWIDERGAKGSSLIKIKNEDQLCLARALVTAKAHEEQRRINGKYSQATDYEKAKVRNNWNNVREGDKARHTQQKKQAQQLMKDAGLEDHVGPCGNEELRRLHQQLPGYQINVISSEQMMTHSYSKGTGHKLYLLHHNNHYDVITSLPGFYGTSYYCEFCKKGYSRKRSHVTCGHRCRCCYEMEACSLEGWVSCNDCRRWFLSQKCFDQHKVKKTNNVRKGKKWMRIEQSTCDRVYKCEGCDKHLQKGINYSHKHECGKVQCKFCKEAVEIETHLCHIQQVTKEPKPLLSHKKIPSFIYFDTETTQDTVIGEDKNGQIKQHNVNCVCYTKLCDLCVEDTSGNQCKNCKAPRVGEWFGDDAFDNFCEWLISIKNEGCYVLAHNARGFDGQFLLNWLQRKGFPPSNVLTRGLEIISMDFSNIRLLDSLNFLPFPLSAFPKTMGFDAAKGTFPHLFNKKDNYEYRGPLPPKEDYGTKSMKPKQLETFNKWYESELKLGKEFVFKEELLKYCHLDVSILAQGCMKMRQIVMTEHDLDPFTCSITLASLCMYIFRKRFLKPLTIGVVPNGGYRKREKHSVIAMKWLKLMSRKHNLNIQHARNGGEAKILNYKVDGLVRGGNDVFEFYGCIYHGCPECFPNPNQQLPMSSLTAGEALQRTISRHKELSEAGYNVHYIWECKFRQQLRNNPEEAEEIKQMYVAEPMDPREAFYGGRTNCRQMYYKVKPGEKIQYKDKCSLYPFICKYGKFPVGHPDIITENFEPIEQRSYEGIIKAKVLVPSNLLHPVLPYKSRGKLLFPNCRTCAETRNDNNCEHSDEERAILGAWPSCELYKAMDLGCRVTELIEVYHFTEWSQYDKEDDETGLFTGYINSCLKKKQEASGWPAWVKTEEDKDKYIRDYEEHEHIKLDRDNIQRNEGMRTQFKLFMNAFWGKFGQRSGLLENKYFTDPDPYFDLVFDPSIETHSIKIINDFTMYVSYRKMEDFVEDAANTNVIVAAWVTAQARLELYQYLEQLGDRVLYMDTDSIIYVTRPDDTYEPPSGDHLGDLTDELDGGTITEFVSLGPKQYSYINQSPTGETSTVCKIRGFTLDCVAVNKINFLSMKNLTKLYLKDRTQAPITVVSSRLRRTKDRNIVTRFVAKTYSVVYDKCRVLPSGQTVPFGFNV